MTEISLSTAGPYSPERTSELASALAEIVRCLNHATHPGNDGGLEYPADAYDLLGHLYTATGGLPQLCAQLTTFLARQGASGTLADDHDCDVAGQIADASYRLGHASQFADDLTTLLQQAQNAISGLHVKEAGNG
jgi:hypothetical protein